MPAAPPRTAINPVAVAGALIAGVATVVYNAVEPSSAIELMVFFAIVFYTLGQIMPYQRH